MTDTALGTTMADDQHQGQEPRMDMEEHTKTFSQFMNVTKWSAFFVAVAVAFLMCAFALDWPLLPTILGFLIGTPVVAFAIR